MKIALVVALLVVAAAAEYRVASTDMRIVGGSSVPSPNPYPWVARLEFWCADNDNDRFICSGSVLLDNVVLTAAHCTITDCTAGLQATVSVGREADDPEETMSVEKFITHGSYSDVTNENDVALWILTNPLTKVQKYPSIPISGVNTGLSVIAAGFGKVLPIDGSPLANNLQQVGLEVQPDGVCGNYFEYYNSDTEICAGADGGGRDTCGGDSGGPLFTTDDCCYYPGVTLRGITSYGSTTCGDLDGAVYTDVSKFNVWISAALLGESILYTPPGPQCCECDGSSGDIGNEPNNCTLSWAPHLTAPILLVVIAFLASLQFM